MLSNFQLAFGQVATLFVLVAVGAVTQMLKLLDERSVRGMVNVLIYVVTPALIIEVFQRPFDRALISQFVMAFAVAVAWHLALVVLSGFFVRGDDAAGPVLRYSIVFSNAGFMGLPLQYAILGAKGVFFGIVYVAIFNLFNWSWGVGQMIGGKARGDRMRALVNPGTVGIAIGLPFFLCSLSLPQLVRTPVKMLADLNTPLAMIVIGYYLAASDLRRVVRMPRAYFTAALRLLVCPLLLLACFCLLRGILDRSLMLAMLIATSAPVAAMAAMFASKYSRDVDLAVGLVGGTTLLSIVTLPLVISLSMWLLP